VLLSGGKKENVEERKRHFRNKKRGPKTGGKGRKKPFAGKEGENNLGLLSQKRKKKKAKS